MHALLWHTVATVIFPLKYTVAPRHYGTVIMNVTMKPFDHLPESLLYMPWVEEKGEQRILLPNCGYSLRKKGRRCWSASS